MNFCLFASPCSFWFKHVLIRRFGVKVGGERSFLPLFNLCNVRNMCLLVQLSASDEKIKMVMGGAWLVCESLHKKYVLKCAWEELVCAHLRSNMSLLE